MSGTTTIEWTEKSWNPVRGCDIVSPGCTNCYAMRVAHRFSAPGGPYEGLTKGSKAGPVWSGRIRLVPEALEDPKSWRKPARVFVNSMSDLFHDDVPTDFIAQVFQVMAECPRHTFQILTKRPARMLQLLAHDLNYEGPQWPLPNVWLGVSVERQKEADERIPLLLQTPSAVRWISAEPLLGPVDLRAMPLPSIEEPPATNAREWPGLNWVVAGGESGPGARPMHPDWARGLRDQCEAAGVPFFFKQWGSWSPYCSSLAKPKVIQLDGITLRSTRKKGAGRRLDGEEHNGYPHAP